MGVALFSSKWTIYTRQRPKSKSIFSFAFFFVHVLCGDNFVRDFLKHILNGWVTFIVKHLSHMLISNFPFCIFASPPHALIFIYFPFNLFWRNFSYIAHCQILNEQFGSDEKRETPRISNRSAVFQFNFKIKISNVNQRIKIRLKKWKKANQ